MIGEVLIKEAKKHGNGALIIVPKRWIGFMVRCEVKRKAKGNPLTNPEKLKKHRRRNGYAGRL